MRHTDSTANLKDGNTGPTGPGRPWYRRLSVAEWLSVAAIVGLLIALLLPLGDARYGGSGSFELVVTCEAPLADGVEVLIFTEHAASLSEQEWEPQHPWKLTPLDAEVQLTIQFDFNGRPSGFSNWTEKTVQHDRLVAVFKLPDGSREREIVEIPIRPKVRPYRLMLPVPASSQRP